MSQHTENRPKPRRRRKSSGWLTSTLFIAALSVAGVYCIWGDAPLERTWNQLGFGTQDPAKSNGSDRQAAAPVPRMKAVDAMEFPGTVRETDEFSQTASIDEPEAPAPNFLPNSRRRPNIPQNNNPFVDDASASAVLDDRFEQENLDRKTASVRNAGFADGISQATPTSEQAREMARPNVPQLRTSTPTSSPFDDGSDIQLIAGDRPAAKGTAKRPPRPNLAVNPAASNTPNVPTNVSTNKLDLTAIQAMVDRGEDVAAYDKLSDAYFHHPSQRPMFQAQLDEVAKRLYFSPQTQIQPPYEIQPGDQLRKIANKYQLSWQYLSRLNQVDAKKIRPGKKLKVFQGPFEARVDLSDFELTILLNGKYVKRYQVGTGKMNTTPIGDFTVQEKLENPTYYGPDGLVMQPDDPQNPLGERWVDIGNSFGIHGTIEPDSIGKSESAGCVRMRNDDVAEVYDLLTIGSTVRIQR
ncbi:MAG: L,D-transpeptidase family protein [Planctomycetota bacterium]